MEDMSNYLKTLFSESTLSLVMKALGALLVLLVGFWAIKKCVALISGSKLAEKMDRGLVNFLGTCASILLKILLLLSVAGYLGIPTTSFLTLLGTVGLAIGMSLQGSLSNLAGGIVLLVFKPFKVNDYIESAAGSGTVRDIGLMYTTVVTIDGKKLVIPNATVSNASVTNYSSEPVRRLELKVCAAYSSDIDTMNALLCRVAGAHPLVLKDPAPFARLLEMGDSALVFTLRAWCKNEDYWTVYFDLMEQVKKELDKNGVEIPFPQLDIHEK